jgi:hypothetical protein
MSAQERKKVEDSLFNFKPETERNYVFGVFELHDSSEQ